MHMGHNHHNQLSGREEVHKVAYVSALAAGFLTIGKLIVGFQTHSIGILAEASHSVIDFVAAMVTVWAVKTASMPADEDHHFGHGKAENIAALFETFLLWITCLWILWEALNRLFAKAPIEIEPGFWGFAVLGVSIIVDLTRANELSRVAKKYNSQSLAADALHFQTDAYSSITVLLGLVFYALGFKYADAIAAILVVVWTVLVSIRLAKTAFDHLMDRAPDGGEEQILALLRQVPEVKVVSSIKVRQSGPETFVNITIGLDKHISLEEAHRITDSVEEKIQHAIARSVINIHPEPI
jgi:cation diffusion facilitator family transporter